MNTFALLLVSVNGLNRYISHITPNPLKLIQKQTEILVKLLLYTVVIFPGEKNPPSKKVDPGGISRKGLQNFEAKENLGERLL